MCCCSRVVFKLWQSLESIAQGNYDEAKPLFERAIAIGEKTLGAEHPAFATRLNNMAVLMAKQVHTTRLYLVA